MKLSKGFWVIALVGLAAGVLAESAYRFTIFGTGSRHDTVEWDFVEPSAGSAMNLVPGTTNTNSIGTSSKRVKDIEAVTANFSGATTFTSMVNVSTSAAVSGTLRMTGALGVGSITVATSTPPFAGALGVDSSNVLYVATGSTHSGDWTKVGAQ